MRHRSCILIAACLALVSLPTVGCVTSPDDDPNMTTGTNGTNNTNGTNGMTGDDAGNEPTGDAGIDENDAGSTDTTYRYVLIEDMTPVGQGLALDAVEACNQLGQACAPLTEVIASSDDALDYSGATNGANAQDASCTEESFTRLGGTPNWVILGLSDTEARIEAPMKLNVWTGQSQCPLVEAGDKAFSVKLGDSTDRATFVSVDDCLGTCTIEVP